MNNRIISKIINQNDINTFNDILLDKDDAELFKIGSKLIQYNHPNIFFKLLVEKLQNINFKDSDGNSLLLLSIKSNQFRKAIILLKNSASVNVVNRTYNSPLSMLIEKNYVKFNSFLTKYILERTHSYQSKSNHPRDTFHLAVYHQRSDLIDLMGKFSILNVNKEGKKNKYPIMTAIENNDLPMVKVLVKYGCTNKTCQNGLTVIQQVIKSNLKNILNELLKSEQWWASLSVLENNILQEAIINQDNSDLFFELFNQGKVDIHHKNKMGENIFFTACKEMKTDIIEYLFYNHKEMDFESFNNIKMTGFATYLKVLGVNKKEEFTNQEKNLIFNFLKESDKYLGISHEKFNLLFDIKKSEHFKNVIIPMIVNYEKQLINKELNKIDEEYALNMKKKRL